MDTIGNLFGEQLKMHDLNLAEKENSICDASKNGKCVIGLSMQ